MVMWIIIVIGAMLGFCVACAIGDGLLIIPVMGGLFAWLLIGMPALWIKNSNVEPQYDNYNTPISVINDGAGVEGRFILGTGTVEGKNIFNYYEPQEDGSNLLKQIDAEGVRVFQDADKPYLTHLGHCSDDAEWFYWCNDEGHGTVTEVHVPKGSIRTNTVLDAN